MTDSKLTSSPQPAPDSASPDKVREAATPARVANFYKNFGRQAAGVEPQDDPNPEWEAKYAATRKQGVEDLENEYDSPREGLEAALRMLEKWTPYAHPANEHGQVHFARAMMESVEDAIRKFLAGDAGGEPVVLWRMSDWDGWHYAVPPCAAGDDEMRMAGWEALYLAASPRPEDR